MHLPSALLMGTITDEPRQSRFTQSSNEGQTDCTNQTEAATNEIQLAEIQAERAMAQSGILAWRFQSEMWPRVRLSFLCVRPWDLARLWRPNDCYCRPWESRGCEIIQSPGARSTYHCASALAKPSL